DYSNERLEPGFRIRKAWMRWGLGLRMVNSALQSLSAKCEQVEFKLHLSQRLVMAIYNNNEEIATERALIKYEVVEHKIVDADYEPDIELVRASTY
ncbi:hypothetical protein Tco_1332443, partial [Tanacetum coccineum]